jgi:hypothetical protein
MDGNTLRVLRYLHVLCYMLRFAGMARETEHPAAALLWQPQHCCVLYYRRRYRRPSRVHRSPSLLKVHR